MKKILAGVVVLAMGVLTAPATAAPAYAASNYAVGQFNMAGGDSQFGHLGNEAPDALVRSVNDRKPAWMTLEESCADWNSRLVGELPEYKIVFAPVKTSKGGPTAQCKHPTEFGNSILYRTDFGFDPPERKREYDLQSPADREQREMLCLKAPAKKVAACAIHLTNGDSDDRVQARRHEAEVAQKILAEKEYVGYTIFLGGDLNDDPLSGVADHFYDRSYGSGAQGRYNEVDSPCANRLGHGLGDENGGPLACRRGRPTHGGFFGGSKIDYIFVSPSVTIVRTEVGHALHSDHSLLWSWVSF